jgi:hypothetical protein
MMAVERAGDIQTQTVKQYGEKKWIMKSIPVEKVYSNLFHNATEVSLSYNTLEPKLGDRIVNLCSPGVPFGFRGTVVTIHTATRYVEVSAPPPYNNNNNNNNNNLIIIIIYL